MADIDFEPIDFEPEAAPTQKGAKSVAKVDFEPIDFEPEAAAKPTSKKERSMADRIMAAMTGFSDTATFGHIPHLQAAFGAGVVNPIAAAVTGNPDYNKETYVQLRDQNIKRRAQLEKENPAEYMGGQGTGFAATMLLPGGAAAKGAGWLGKGMMAMGSGAAMSGLQNPGDVEGKVDPFQIGDRATQAAWGAGTSMLLGAGGHVVGKGMERMAKRSAFKALGPFARDARLSNDFGRVDDIGEAALENGVIGWIPRSYNKLKERASAAAGKAGKEVGDHIDELENAVQNSGGKIKGIDKSKVSKKLSEKVLVDPDTAQGVAGAVERNDKMGKYISEFGDEGELALKKGWEKKKLADKNSGWKKMKTDPLTPEEEFNRNLAHGLKDGFEETAANVEKATGKKTGTYSEKAKKYSSLLTADRILGMREGHDIARRMALPSAGAGLGAFAGLTSDDPSAGNVLGSMLKGAAVAKTAQYANRFAPQLAAKGLDAASKKMMINNPWLIPSMVKEFQGGKNGEEN